MHGRGCMSPSSLFQLTTESFSNMTHLELRASPSVTSLCADPDTLHTSNHMNAQKHVHSLS